MQRREETSISCGVHERELALPGVQAAGRLCESSLTRYSHSSCWTRRLQRRQADLSVLKAAAQQTQSRERPRPSFERSPAAALDVRGDQGREHQRAAGGVGWWAWSGIRAAARSRWSPRTPGSFLPASQLMGAGPWAAGPPDGAEPSPRRARSLRERRAGPMRMRSAAHFHFCRRHTLGLPPLDHRSPSG